MEAIDQGRAVLVRGKIRFIEDSKHLGYNSAGGNWIWGGRQSGPGGPTVLQAIHAVG